MKQIAQLTLLASLLTLSAPDAMPALPNYQDFDQAPGHGWRSLAEQKRLVEAAQMIESYLAEQRKLTEREKANLHFHAAQCLATEGSAASLQAALAHLLEARVNPEPPHLPIRWNDYVDATEAFLKGDLAALKAARERIAMGPKFNGEAANLDVVDRLIAKFGTPYADAYGASSDAKTGKAPPNTRP